MCGDAEGCDASSSPEREPLGAAFILVGRQESPTPYAHADMRSLYLGAGTQSEATFGPSPYEAAFQEWRGSEGARLGRIDAQPDA